MATVVKMNLKEYQAYINRLGDKLMPAATRGIRSAGYRCVVLLQERTRKAPPASPNGAVGAFNTGAFLQRWRQRPITGGMALFNDAPYAGVIEKGRRRGARMPPSEPIIRWAQRRLGMTEAEAKQAAYLIRRAISRRGLQGRRILRDAIPELKQLVHAEMIHEFERELKR